MFDKVQESLKKSKDERQKKRLEKERVRLEKAAAEAVREKERLQQEAKKIQAEKDRLLSLDDKGLMVELILAVRGLYSQIEYIQSQQESLSERIDDIERRERIDRNELRNEHPIDHRIDGREEHHTHGRECVFQQSPRAEVLSDPIFNHTTDPLRTENEYLHQTTPMPTQRPAHLTCEKQ
mgnify:CR=1 FL=1